MLIESTKDFKHVQAVGNGNVKSLEAIWLRVSNAVNRHHELGKSYEENHLIVTCLQFQKFSSLPSWHEAWQHGGRYGV